MRTALLRSRIAARQWRGRNECERASDAGEATPVDQGAELVGDFFDRFAERAFGVDTLRGAHDRGGSAPLRLVHVT
jgi:hypothetical protein